jgi:hypothetical protein
MERADGIAVVDPAESHGAIGVGAASQERVELPTVVEDRDPQSVDFDGLGTPFGNVRNSTHSHKFRHRLTRFSDSEKTRGKRKS